MVLAIIADDDAVAAEWQIERCGLSNQRSFRVTAGRSIAVRGYTSGPSIEAVASASTQSLRLQSSEPVTRIPLSFARIS
jgi:hypothetical protein